MATKRQYEQLAKLKEKEKEIKGKIDELQEKIICSGRYSTEKETSIGILKYRERSNYSITQNKKLIENTKITEQDFIDKAKLAPSTVKKMVGEIDFNNLVQDGVINEGKTSKYFELRKPKNQEQE